MEIAIDRYSNLLILVPVALMFVIIACIVHKTIGDIELFQGGSRIVISLCVSGLAIYGLDRTLIRFVVDNYTSMGITMLITLTSMLGLAWFKISRKK